MINEIHSFGRKMANWLHRRRQLSRPEVLEPSQYFLPWGSSSRIPHNNLHAKLLFHWFSFHRMHFCVTKTKPWAAGDSPWVLLVVSGAAYNAALGHVIPQYFCKWEPRTDHQKIVKFCRKSPFPASPILAKHSAEIGGFVRRWTLVTEAGGLVAAISFVLPNAWGQRQE